MICSLCKQDKPEIEFNFRNTKTQTRYKHCRQCQKSLRQQSYLRHRDYYLQYDKNNAPKRRKLRRDFIIKSKEGKPCADCGQTYPHYVMDFDHLPFFKKRIKIGQQGNYHSEQVLLEEFAKCELVCANCHRERTWRRKH